jgi:hypothetical protein
LLSGRTDETDFRDADAIIDAGFSADKNSFTIMCLSVDKSLQAREYREGLKYFSRALTYQLAETMKVGAVPPLAVARPLVCRQGY